MNPKTSAQPIPLDEYQSPLPSMPQRVEDTGLDFSFLVELLTKILYVRGQLHLPELATHAQLSLGALEALLTFMRGERLCEMVRHGETHGTMAYTLTDLGRTRAKDFLERCQYAGPAPVSLNAYVKQVAQQSIMNMGVTRETVQRAFEGIVVRQDVLDQFGA